MCFLLFRFFANFFLYFRHFVCFYEQLYSYDDRTWNVTIVIHISTRRKTTRTKYDPPYIKKPVIKGAGNSNHVSVEEVSLDGSNKLITYGNQFRSVTIHTNQA